MARRSNHPKPRRMTVDKWSQHLAKYGYNQEDKRYGDYMGLSPGGAAAHLGVGEPMIHHLIRKGILDVIELEDAFGGCVAWLCTDNSVDAYREKQKAFAKP